MRITRIETVVVYGPRKLAFGGAYRTALGGDTHSEHGLVFVRTDKDITGIGEISSVFTRRGRLLCREVDDRLGPALVGEDPFRINHLVRKMDVALEHSEPA
ncbi:MAG: hypothetical protein ACREGL_04155, partial [Alphaproteobacteria bacterium]